MFTPPKGIAYRLKVDSHLGKDKKPFAKAGEKIFIYDESRRDVFLAYNSKNETFSVRAVDVEKL